MADQDSDRCWPGYEPVPGKPEHSEGSCRKSAPSKTTKAGKDHASETRETARCLAKKASWLSATGRSTPARACFGEEDVSC